MSVIKCKDTKETASTYAEYLTTKHWRILRMRVALRERFYCEKCKRRIWIDFQIHHKTYKRIGKEWLKDLMFLCVDCHKAIHKTLKVAPEYSKNPPKTKKRK